MSGMDAWNHPGLRSTAPQLEQPVVEYAMQRMISLALADDEAVVAALAAHMVDEAVRDGDITGQFTWTHRVARTVTIDGEPVPFTDDDGNELPATAMLVVDLHPGDA